MSTITKPYKLTPERSQIILEALEDGMTQRDASMLAGISEDTLCLWKRNNSDFSEQMAQSVIKYKQKILKGIQKAGEKDWKALAYLAERRFKRDFSPEVRYESELVYDHPPFEFNIQRISDEVIRKL